MHYPGSPEDSLIRWEHKDAVTYARKMIAKYGKPDSISDHHLGWMKPQFAVSYHKIKDEMVPHDFPKDHHDFVYSFMDYHVLPKYLEVFGHVTGSIGYDGLKQSVWARCGSLGANAVTLDFVKDVCEGNMINAKEVKDEYSKRMKAYEKPDWWEDKMGDFNK